MRASASSLLGFAAVLLAACSGGGGGGGGGSDGGGGSGGGSSGVSTPAVQAGSLILFAVDEVGSIALKLPLNVKMLQQEPSGTLSLPCGDQGSFALSYADRDGDLVVSVGDELHAAAEGCGAYGQDLRLTISALEGSVDRLEGHVEFESKYASGSSLSGSFDLAFDSTADRMAWRAANVTAEGGRDGVTGTFDSMTFEKSLTSSGNAVTASGAAAGGALGPIRFETTSALTAPVGLMPTQGTLTIEIGGSTVRFQPSAGPSTAEYQTGADGTGRFGPATPVDWISLFEGRVFDRPTSALAVLGVQIFPTPPTTTDTISTGPTVLNLNRRRLFLSYAWRRNGSIIEGETGRELDAAFTQRGDTIDAIVAVTDGISSITGIGSVVIENAPPRLPDFLTIAPDPPYTNDDLVAGEPITDPDGDTLEITYTWQRNGHVIFGQNARVLPADQQQKGDVIGVSVTASDGRKTSTAVAPTVTVRDSPPVFDVPFSPTSVRYGAPETFEATLTDADPGDSLGQYRFVLDYGPAGMALDPRTGAVVWTPAGPMFGSTMDFHWSISVQGLAGATRTGTIQVEDPSSQYPLMRTVNAGRMRPHGLVVTDLDGDGVDEMLVVTDETLSERKWNGVDYAVDWMHPFAVYRERGAGTISAGDVDGDGHDEIFLSAGNEILELDGTSREIVHETQIGVRNFCKQLAYTDLEGDGPAELLCMAGVDDDPASAGPLIVLAAADLGPVSQIPALALGRSFAVGNVDRDSAPEIVTGAGYVFDGATLANEWLYGPGFGVDVAVGDLDGDGVDEIVGSTATEVRAFSALQKGVLTDVATGYAISGLWAADVDSVAGEEILVGDAGNAVETPTVTAYRYDAATRAAGIAFRLDAQADPGALGVGDVDGDGEPEIVWSAGSVVAGLDPPAVEWSNGSDAALPDGYAGGLPAHDSVRSETRILFSWAEDSFGRRLVGLSTDSGTVSLSGRLGDERAGNAIGVGDYDEDGVDEAFGAFRQYDPSARAEYLFYYAADPFASTVEWSDIAQTEDRFASVVANADVNGDGRDDLILLTNATAGTGNLQVFDVSNRRPLWESGELQAPRDLAAADLDGDGVPEIVVALWNSLLRFDRDTASGAYVRSAMFALAGSEQFRDLTIGDVDGDGQPDIETVILYGPSPSLIARFDASLRWTGSVDLDVDVDNLVVEPWGSSARKNLLVTTGRNTDAPYVLAVDPSSGGEVWRSPPLLGMPVRNSLHAILLNGESRYQLALGTATAMYVTR